MSRLIRLVSINEHKLFKNNNAHIEYYLSDCYINKNFVIKIREDLKMLELFISNKLPSFFPENQKFTLITLAKGINAEDISVVGPTELIIKKFED